MLYAQFVFSFPPSFIENERERGRDGERESSSDWVSCTLHSKFPHHSSCYMCSQISLQSTFYASTHTHEQIINSCKVQGENKSTSRRKKEKPEKKNCEWRRRRMLRFFLVLSSFFFRLLFTFLSENNSRSFVRKFEFDHNNDRIERRPYRVWIDPFVVVFISFFWVIMSIFFSFFYYYYYLWSFIFLYLRTRLD